MRIQAQVAALVGAAVAIAATVVPAVAQEPAGEPLELVQLRRAWEEANHRGARPIKESYLKALTRLKTEFINQNQLREALPVTKEITRLIENEDLNEASKHEPSRLSALRTTYRRELETVTNTNERKYVAALEELRRQYVGGGEHDAALAVQVELARLQAGVGPVTPFASIEIRGASTRVSVQNLRAGVQRLSGGYRPAFKAVSDELEGTRFVRVPWQSKHKWTVRVTSPGLLYAMKLDGEHLKEASPAWRQKPGLLTGPYIKAVYESRVAEGVEFEVTGYELCLVAGEIVLKR